MPAEGTSRLVTRVPAQREHYDAVTIWLHWSTVALVVILWTIGQVTGWLPRGSFRTSMWSTHVALGTIFALVLAVRILWRASVGSALPAADSGVLNWLAKGTHYALYLVLLATVSLGIVNAAYRGYDMYGVVAFPRFGSGDPATEHAINSWHIWAANLTVILAFFHAAAALAHQYIWHDHLVERMRPPGGIERSATETALGVARSGEDALHRVVVVGGGAAGLELATRLGNRLGRRGQAEVALVDCARTHLWKPLLHEVAAGSLDQGENELNYLAQAHWHSFRFRFGEMIGLDRARQEVTLAATFDDEGRNITPPRAIGYDTLVIAIGSVTNDFGTPGVAEHAVPLETTAQAARFNQRLVNACLRAQAQPEAVRAGQLHIAIVGAGATGTELAAELHRTAREVVAYGLDRIDPNRDIRIVLIEAADRVLPGLPERISKATLRLLQEMGVEVRTGAKVAEVTAQGLRLADGSFVRSELVVWAAGVKAPAVLRDLDGLESNRVNQLVVEPTLQTTRDPDIFAIGDCAACLRPGKQGLVPPRAQAAHQQAAHVLWQIERRLHAAPLLPYRYRDFGSLVSLGRSSTVGNLMGFLSGRGLFVEGLFAQLMYRSLRLMHERALHGTARAVLGAFVRSLSRRTGPPVKLH
jgi:NADH dehydrogenase